MSETDSDQKSRRPVRFRRIGYIVALGLLLVGGVYFFRYFWLEHPVGHGPAGPSVPRAVFRSSWTENKVLLVGLGDSITDGLGASPASKSYFNCLIKNPSDEFPAMQGICLSRVIPSLKSENLARSGTTSIEHLEYLIPELQRQGKDTFGIVVITSGGNDIIHDYGRGSPREGAMYGATFQQAQPWIENYRRRLGTILDEVQDRFPGGCRVFIGNIYDPTDGVGNAITAGLPRWPDALSIMRAYNTIIAETAQHRADVHLVDIHQSFLGHGIYSRQFWNANYRAGDPHYWYWQNFEDPNNRGYDCIRRLFLFEMARVLPPLFADMKRKQRSGS